MRSRLAAALLVVSIALLPAKDASAMLDVSPNYGNLEQVINTICLTCVKVKPGKDGAPHPVTPQGKPVPYLHGGDTGYLPSPGVSARVKALFVERVAKKAGPERAKQVAAALAKLDIPTAWGSIVSSDGLRTCDVSDALAGYYLANWMVANQADDTRAQTLAVRNALHVQLNGPLRRVPNDARQEYAESLMLGFLLTLKPYADARKAGDTQTARKLSDQAEANFLASTKTDLRRLSLTDQGFVAKP